MGLFACSRCHCLENTALGEFWYEHAHGEPVLCSECSTGEWHGKWDKRLATEADNVMNPEALVERPGEEG